MADPGFEVRVDPTVHAAHPDYVALVLLASGLANGPSDAGSDAQLAAAEAHLRASNLARATDHPHIAAWRAAFSAFGAKPKRYPSSAEALITRVLKGQALPRVNALVDLYNAISVRHVVPLGGEDADRRKAGCASPSRRAASRSIPAATASTSSRSRPGKSSGAMTAA